MSKLRVSIRHYTEHEGDIELPFYMKYTPLGQEGGGFIKIEEEYLVKEIKMDAVSLQMTVLKSIPASYFLSSNNYTPCTKEDFDLFFQEAFNKSMTFLTTT